MPNNAMNADKKQRAFGALLYFSGYGERYALL
jgi:hypothetical protein